MELEEALARLGMTAAADVFRPYWQESMASLPQGPARFLDPGELVSRREYCRLGPEADESLLGAARIMREEPALTCLAWRCAEAAFATDGSDQPASTEWPAPEKAMGKLAPCFFMIVAMEGMARARAIHERLGVPEAISRDTCSDLAIGARRRRRLSGVWGFDPALLSWTRVHAKGLIYRLGRLQYVRRAFRGWVRVYVNNQTGATLALAEDGMRYCGSGWVDGAGGVTDEENGWEANLVEDENDIRGYPVSPYGAALRREVRLPREQWDPALRKGDPVLEIHIPEGPPLTAEASRDSLDQAVEFFPRYFPEQGFRGFACYTWLMGPQWPEFLKPESNIVRWQRQVYSFPVPSPGRQAGLYFVFWKRGEIDPATAPRNTALQRAALTLIERGEPVRGGAMFMLREHLQLYGSAHYVSQWDGLRREVCSR